MRAAAAACALLALAVIDCARGQARYFGKELGALSRLQHGVRGQVFAVDARTLYIADFHYDGEGPAAYFYVGTSESPNAAGVSSGTRLRDERGGAGPLRRYRGESITLSLPDGAALSDYKWFAVWCDQYSINFGSVSIPRGLTPPRPARVGALRGVHGVASDPVVVVDAQTLLVPNFSYDGEAPDAKFWVGRGDKPSPQGIRIPDENGKETPLRKYDKKTIVLTLPGELTVFDIGHFAVWCEAFTVNFGHVPLPRAQLANVPPSLKMLGVSPQSKLNCEVLHDELAFEVRWAVAGDSLVLQLVAKLEDGEYMSFGLSGSAERSQMVGGDVAVAWVDKASLKGFAVDYYLDAKSQCAGVHGSCPDVVLGAENSVRLLNAALVNGYSIVTYQRGLRAADQLDRPVLLNGSQPVIWAIGPLNSKNEVSYHHHYTKGDLFLEFGRPPVWNCPMPEGEEETPLQEPQKEQSQEKEQVSQQQTGHVIKPNPVPPPAPVSGVKPWEIPSIQCYEPPDGVFYAQMGPTGGKQGYSAITGHVGWGISWYINGLLIPEVNVVRGRKYTFVVEGGSDPGTPARYHPFYITNDPVGGYFHKTDDEKKGVEIYAGVRRARNGELTPTGVGRLCNWTPDADGPPADDFPSFGAYQRSLTLACEEGNPGVVAWTPDAKTPDTVYYQCFTHRHLGWKINVLDECDETDTEESRLVESLALPDELQSDESIQVYSRVAPHENIKNLNILDQRRKVQKIINTKMNGFSSYMGAGGLTGEVYPGPDRTQSYSKGQEYELPVSHGQIKDVIQTVETLENQMKNEMRKNASHAPLNNYNQYQVHEDVKEMFVPEQPIQEDDEYFFDQGTLPENYLLPPNTKPLTLQSVLRPSGPNRPSGSARPPFRRPVPPEIKLRRPPPMYQKGNGGYPLPLPSPHGPHRMQKKPPPKFVNRVPPNMNKSPMSGIPPMKVMPPHHQSKPMFNQQLPKQLPKIPNVNMQAPKHQNSGLSGHPVIQGKPNKNLGPLQTQSQTLSLGQTDIIANQVVKSQITLPGGGDAVAQQSTVQTYFNIPGQIILGKPMDHPAPLDQQMIPTKKFPTKTPPTSVPVFPQPTPSFILKQENEQQSQNEIKSSDFIGESTETSSIRPAVNTGFKPDSIVVESGFKPIIREPLMAAEDRIADGDGGSNRREDTDVEEDYEEPPQYSSNHAYSSDKMTETFEPMFIPSPPDHLLATKDDGQRTKEVFPINHAKEDRPHPVYVKTENELNALFGKKNIEKDIPSDLIMESDRISPHYLPPDPKLPKEYSQKLSMGEQTFTTYDGKIVSAATLISVPEVNKSTTKLFSSKLPANSEQLLKTPQFGPFKGEIPPPVAEHNIKDAQSSLPADKRTTHLKLVNVKPGENKGDLKSEASEDIEVVSKTDEEEEERERYDGVIEDSKRRKRDTKTTQFERGEIEEVQTNGHSMPKNQVDFETLQPVAAAANKRLCRVTHIVLLALCLNFV